MAEVTYKTEIDKKDENKWFYIGMAVMTFSAIAFWLLFYFFYTKLTY
jgi:hypothetical protein